MSWQLASFALVLAALAVAFWWYERSQSPAKLIAVVATLAALAALGRDAFAAIPDVKPITAIVLVSGVAFGAAPGFAVGALGALASNILLGEGPWTPWQMLGWGLVGLIGATLGAATRRRVSALALALACALAAEAFNLVLDAYTWIGSGSHTLAGFAVVLSAALAFDITHVVASFAFGLAFAAVLLRMLVRVRERMYVSWQPVRAGAFDVLHAPALVVVGGGGHGGGGATPPGASSDAASVRSGEVPPPRLSRLRSGPVSLWRGMSSPARTLALALVALALAVATVALATDSGSSARSSARASAAGGSGVSSGGSGTRFGTGAAGTRADAASVAGQARADVAGELAYLQRAQNPDGGFGAAPGQTSSELYTAWAAIGIAATGRDPLSLRRGRHTILDALRGEAATLQGAGDLERTILALHACGASARSLPAGAAGGDPVKRLLAFRDRDGSFTHLTNLTAFAILALRAAGYRAGAAPVHSAAAWLVRQQERDGGFGFGARGGGSDVDDTAAVLQALAQAGVRGDPTIARAGAYLVRAQNLDGGYPQMHGGQSNAQSTAWAVQGLIAAARSPQAVMHAGSRSPLGYLESLVEPSGSVRYSRTGAQTPVWVTAQALTAFAQRPLPIAPVAR
jgi:energy-coupling factor transport system substrate-specific component